MSTRANIVLKESYSYKAKNGLQREQTNELIFYRHSDGYPEGTLPTLNKFLEWLRKGKIRKDLSQSAGWLILLGAMEYDTIPKFKTKDGYVRDTETITDPTDWKCGAYEPTTCIHGDIDYLYEVDVVNCTVTVKQEQVISYEPFKTEWETVDVSAFMQQVLEK